MSHWINTKTAAARAGISPRTFREDWTPEEANWHCWMLAKALLKIEGSPK